MKIKTNNAYRYTIVCSDPYEHFVAFKGDLISTNKFFKICENLEKLPKELHNSNWEFFHITDCGKIRVVSIKHESIGDRPTYKIGEVSFED